MAYSYFCNIIWVFLKIKEKKKEDILFSVADFQLSLLKWK